MSNELTVVENKPMKDSDILNDNFSFDDKIVIAEHIATSLAKVIKDQKLAVKIQGNNYVTVEGWNTLGTMMGCSAIIEEVTDVTELLKTNDKEMVFKAIVSIRKGETVLSRAFAIASTKKVGKYKTIYLEPFAAYSMAQTRAMGKAYRMAFSWIMKMSGYEPTPEEEMPDILKKAEPDKEETADENVIEAEIVDVTPENANTIDYGDDTLRDLCEDIRATGSTVRKGNLLQLAKKQNCSNEIISYIKGMKPEDLQKYNE